MIQKQSINLLNGSFRLSQGQIKHLSKENTTIFFVDNEEIIHPKYDVPQGQTITNNFSTIVYHRILLNWCNIQFKYNPI